MFHLQPPTLPSPHLNLHHSPPPNHSQVDPYPYTHISIPTVSSA